MKTCTRCHQEKDLIFFSKNSKSRDGKSSHCKKCDKKRQQQARQDAPDIFKIRDQIQYMRKIGLVTRAERLKEKLNDQYSSK